jgi:hypothetical protein
MKHAMTYAMKQTQQGKCHEASIKYVMKPLNHKPRKTSDLEASLEAYAYIKGAKHDRYDSTHTPFANDGTRGTNHMEGDKA